MIQIIKYLINFSFILLFITNCSFPGSSKNETNSMEVDFSYINEDLHEVLAYKDEKQEEPVSSLLIQFALNEEAKKEGWKPIPKSGKIKVAKDSEIELSLGGVVSLGEKKIDKNTNLSLVSIMGTEEKVKNFKYLALSLSETRNGTLTIKPKTFTDLKANLKKEKEEGKKGEFDFGKKYEDFKKEALVQKIFTEILKGKQPPTDNEVDSFGLGLVIPDISQFTIEAINPNYTFKVADEAAFQDNVMNKLAVFDDLLMVFDANGEYFYSSDGKNWISRQLPVESCSGKYPSLLVGYSAYLTFKGKLWGFGNCNSIWDWSKEKYWTFQGEKLPITSMDGGGVVFNEKMWLFLGVKTKSMYSSSDGSNWEKKYTHSESISQIDPVVHENKIWIVGGKKCNSFVCYDSDPSYNKVYSFDGSRFILEGKLPDANSNYGLASFAGGLVLIGGKNETKSFNGLWYSPNGKNWYVLSDDLTKVASGGDAPTGAVYDMIKWKDALWLSDNGKMYKITYTKKN